MQMCGSCAQERKFTTNTSSQCVHEGIDSVNGLCAMCLGLGILVQQREEKKNCEKNIPGLTATSKALLPQDIKRL